MGLKLSLAAKGLILVSIPLLFEVGFVCALVNLQRDTEVQAEQALKNREISNRINTSSAELYQLWNNFDQANLRGHPNKVAALIKFYKSSFLPRLHSIRKDYQSLEDLTEDQPEFNTEVHKIARSLDALQGIIDQLFIQVKGGDLEAVMSYHQRLADNLVTMFQSIVSQNFALLANHERTTAEVDLQRKAATGQVMITAVWIACAINAVFCILLALFLVRDITARLSVLSENARHIEDSEPLNKPLSGDDEIAEVDRAFHRMAASIDETARMRQEFVSMLTHDLRSPLTAIQGTLELLNAEAQKNDSDDREKKLITVAERNSSRMIELINDLLDVQKIKAGMMTISPSKVCLAEVFEEVSLSVSAWAEDHKIKLKVADTEAFVQADRQKLERVIFNLVSNAIKFSPDGGMIELNAQEKGRTVEISVSDQGKGIPAEKQEAIFERFQQVHASDGLGGSGLGLTICQYIVEVHGGRIWVTSKPGQGSTFTFTMPKA